MKVPRPSPGRIVLVTRGMPVEEVAIVIGVGDEDPLLIEALVLSRYGGFMTGGDILRFRYVGASVGPWWRYPPREDRTVDVPDEVAR